MVVQLGVMNTAAFYSLTEGTMWQTPAMKSVLADAVKPLEEPALVVSGKNEGGQICCSIAGKLSLGWTRC